MDSRHNVGTNPWNETAVPVVRSGTHHQSIGQGTGQDHGMKTARWSQLKRNSRGLVRIKNKHPLI